MKTPPLAYFITFTTYGSWLHGRAEGSVDRRHNLPGTPVLPPDARRESAVRATMRQPCYTLDAPRRDVVLRTLLEVCRYRKWTPWAMHVRTNHVHTVVTAPVIPERVMSDFKAWASRRLRESFGEPADRDRWTQHGSTRYLNTEASFYAATEYVINEQGERMSAYDARAPHEPEA